MKYEMQFFFLLFAFFYFFLLAVVVIVKYITHTHTGKLMLITMLRYAMFSISSHSKHTQREKQKQQKKRFFQNDSFELENFRKATQSKKIAM